MIWDSLKKYKIGDSFAVVSGLRTGEMLILFEQNSKEMCFLSYPLNINRVYSVGEFDLDRKQDKIKFIERIPKLVVKQLIVVYNNNKAKGKIKEWDKVTLRSLIKKNENTNHRRK